jgi:hypothetical protein
MMERRINGVQAIGPVDGHRCEAVGDFNLEKFVGAIVYHRCTASIGWMSLKPGSQAFSLGNMEKANTPIKGHRAHTLFGDWMLDAQM